MYAFIWASVAFRGMARWLLGHLLSGFSGVVGWEIYRIVIGILGLWHRDSQISILRNCRVSCRTKTRLFDALLMIGGEAS